MSELALLAPAKVNWVLRILHKRRDNYHEILSLMQRVEWGDEIVLKKGSKGIELSVDPPIVPVSKENIAYRAAEYFFKHYSIRGGVEISIRKRIPVGSGLGGGSSDGAAVLRGLEQLYDVGDSKIDRKEVAYRLGADVPFFLEGSPAMVRGIGECVEPIERFPEIWYLLLIPEVVVSSARAYSLLKWTKREEGMNLPKIYNSIEDLRRFVGNDFEPLVFKEWPQLERYKGSLLESGAEVAGMSGSGSAFWGAFRLKEEARKAQDRLAQDDLKTVLARGEIDMGVERNRTFRD